MHRGQPGQVVGQVHAGHALRHGHATQPSRGQHANPVGNVEARALQQTAIGRVATRPHDDLGVHRHDVSALSRSEPRVNPGYGKRSADRVDAYAEDVRFQVVQRRVSHQYSGDALEGNGPMFMLT